MKAYGRTDRIVGTRKKTDPKRRKKKARRDGRMAIDAWRAHVPKEKDGGDE